MHVCAWCLGGQNRVLGPLQLELWAAEPGDWSSARVASIFNLHHLPVLRLFLFILF